MFVPTRVSTAAEIMTRLLRRTIERNGIAAP
jgi:hypothetical protein